MKLHTSLLGSFVLLFCLAGPAPMVKADDESSVSFSFFYDALDPLGQWVSVEDYGYCWQPTEAYNDPDWRPYTIGRWAYTDSGWTWVSDEEFGWATYHYGRWIRLDRLGWVWVPGYKWAPAWVSWRQSEDEDAYGWAPLPPEAEFNVTIGFNTWVDDYYDIGPACYTFVRVRDFGEPRLCNYMIPRSYNADLCSRSVNITRISYNTTIVNNIFVGGPVFNVVNTHCRRPVERLHMEFRSDHDLDDIRRNSHGRGHDYFRRDGDTLFVAAPRVKAGRLDEIIPHERVKTHVESSHIDRGWHGVGNTAMSDAVRDRMRRDAERSKSSVMPPKAIFAEHRFPGSSNNGGRSKNGDGGNERPSGVVVRRADAVDSTPGGRAKDNDGSKDRPSGVVVRRAESADDNDHIKKGESPHKPGLVHERMQKPEVKPRTVVVDPPEPGQSPRGKMEREHNDIPAKVQQQDLANKMQQDAAERARRAQMNEEAKRRMDDEPKRRVEVKPQTRTMDRPPGPSQSQVDAQRREAMMRAQQQDAAEARRAAMAKQMHDADNARRREAAANEAANRARSEANAAMQQKQKMMQQREQQQSQPQQRRAPVVEPKRQAPSTVRVAPPALQPQVKPQPQMKQQPQQSSRGGRDDKDDKKKRH